MQPLFVEGYPLPPALQRVILKEETRCFLVAEYELVREIPNLCRNNQMRDVFFSEVETEDPVSYVRQFLKGKDITLSSEQRADGTVTVYAVCDGLTQKFIFTPI